VRPLVHPALARVWRDSSTVQVGLDATRAVVLTGLGPAEAAVLRAMDGVRDMGALRAMAEQVGGSGFVADRLVEILSAADVLVDGDRVVQLSDPRDALAPDRASRSLLGMSAGAGETGTTLEGVANPLADRRQAHVGVRGAGRIGATIARLLSAAGVGHIGVEDFGRTTAHDVMPGGLSPDDAGVPRGLAASAALPDVPDRPDESPDLVVLAPVADMARDDAAALLRLGIPHLIACVIETTGVVGPLVLPGRSSCLRCHDMHRTDRDPAWPRVLAQAGGRLPGVAACDLTLAALVAALAAQQVLAHLDGFVPATVDGTVETSLPFGMPRRRSWRPHPACGCTWAA
jgi:ThiF family